MNAPADPRADLLKAFGLGPEDLEANRAGRLSALQAKQLAASGTRNLIGALFGGVVLAAILAFVVNKPLKPAQWITALILFLALLAVGLHDFRKTRAAAGLGVEEFRGPVGVESRGKDGFWLTVAGREFRMPVRPWHVQNGAGYRVYFSARANRVVAMEPAS